MVFEFGGLSERQLDRLRKQVQESGNTSSLFEYFVEINHEREYRGWGSNYSREFFTNSYHYTIFNPPGHRY